MLRQSCLIVSLLFFACTQSAFAYKLKLPLSKVTVAEAIEMECSASQVELPIPIPKRWKVKSATLSFEYHNSSSLIKRTSQLEVRLNNIPVSQTKLDPRANQGRLKLDLPSSLFDADYNALLFKVSQHYTTQCESPCAPELWTKLMLDEAVLELEYEYLPIPLRISAVSDFLFDAKIFPEARVNIITESHKDELLTAATMIASGIALRYDYRTTKFNSSDRIQREMDNVLIGSHGFMKSVLSKYEIDYEASGPYLKLYHLPFRVYDKKQEKWIVKKDPRFALLVIAGDDYRQIKIAAETIDILSIPFPDSDYMEVKGFSMPEIALYSGKKMLTTNKLYKLSKLQFESVTFKGINPNRKDLSFRVPVDFRVKPNQYVNLKLDFSYGAGIRSDSALNIMLNDRHVAAIHLNDEGGSIISGYELNLPTHLFRGGENVLSFQPVLTPSVTEHCSFIQTNNLFLTLFDSSTIFFPSMPHQVDMPNLEFLFINGFPYTRWPDGYESKLYVTSTDHENISVALNLAGMITQKNGYPLFGMEVTTKDPGKFYGELMMVGLTESIPKDYIANAPLKLGDRNQVPYPAFSSWDRRSSLAYSTQVSDMGTDQGLVAQFQSPYTLGRTVTMISARTLGGMKKLGEAILETEIQQDISGDLALVDYVFNPFLFEKYGDGKDYKVTALEVGETFITGKGGQINKVDYYLITYPWLYWVAFLVVVTFLILAIFALLKRQNKKRLAEEESEI